MNDTPETSGPIMPERTQNQGAMYASLAHLAAFAGLFVPFGHILGPFVVWLLKKDESPFVDDQGKEAMNFQISITIYTFILCLGVFMFFFLVSRNILHGDSWLLFGLVLFAGMLFLVDVILVIVAAIKSRDGLPFRYPMCLRLVSSNRSS